MRACAGEHAISPGPRERSSVRCRFEWIRLALKTSPGLCRLVEVPECPLAAHKGARVVRAGWYGKPPHRRQRWKCIPEKGDPHRFSGVLPRQEAKAHACDECETVLEPWEGQQTPKLYGFTTREIAHALILASQGTSYRRSALQVRALADRRRPWTARTPGGGKRQDPNRHAQIVANWIDVFADIIWEAHQPSMWPKRLTVDSTPFFASTGSSGPGARQRKVFYVFGAVGYERRGGRSRVWLLKTSAKDSVKAWRDFFDELPGTPELIVADGSLRITSAINGAFPRPGASPPFFWRCEWHLGRNLRKALPDKIEKNPTHLLHRLAVASVTDPGAWRRLKIHASRNVANYTRLRRWIQLHGHILDTQHQLDRPFPASVGPTEEALKSVRVALDYRAGSFGNRQRTDKLLKLITLQLNGQTDERKWAELIRQHLLSCSGHAVQQRSFDDPSGVRSVRV